MSWADIFRRRSEPPVRLLDGGLSFDELTAIRERVEAQVAAEPPIEVAPLPPYDHDAKCPKCHFIAGTTEHKAGFHGNECSIPERPYDLFENVNGFGMWGTPKTVKQAESDARATARWNRRRDAIPEHFERECPNCKHRWAEAVVPA